MQLTLEIQEDKVGFFLELIHNFSFIKSDGPHKLVLSEEPVSTVAEPLAAYGLGSRNIVTIDPEVMSGTPVFAGTRVPVKSLFDWLETETLEEFLENFPSVRKEHAVAVLRYAERSLFTPEMAEHEVTA